jgi:hypothetical protein
MGKAKRKINRLRRKKLKQLVRPRIPIAPPGWAHKTDKDYDRKKVKKETKELVKEDE